MQGAQLLPTLPELFISLFADDIVLLSTTPEGLQALLNLMKECWENTQCEQKKVLFFERVANQEGLEKWFYANAVKLRSLTVIGILDLLSLLCVVQSQVPAILQRKAKQPCTFYVKLL